MAEQYPACRATLTRRRLLQGTARIGVFALLPAPTLATPDTMAQAIRAHFGTAPISIGRVALTMPALAENGNSVELMVAVESPMTASDHVRSIAIFAEKNPYPQTAVFHLGPRNGLARVTTRIRLADSQTITAIAEMNDGGLWSGTASTVVTLAACLDLT